MAPTAGIGDSAGLFSAPGAGGRSRLAEWWAEESARRPEGSVAVSRPFLLEGSGRRGGGPRWTGHVSTVGPRVLDGIRLFLYFFNSFDVVHPTISENTARDLW